MYQVIFCVTLDPIPRIHHCSWSAASHAPQTYSQKIKNLIKLYSSLYIFLSIKLINACFYLLCILAPLLFTPLHHFFSPSPFLSPSHIIILPLLSIYPNPHPPINRYSSSLIPLLCNDVGKTTKTLKHAHTQHTHFCYPCNPCPFSSLPGLYFSSLTLSLLISLKWER